MMSDNSDDETNSSFFSYKSFAGLKIVCDNARTHEPFHHPNESSSSSGTSSASRSRAPSPISPERGLTRWGSEEDLHSQTIPRQPSRGDLSGSSPVDVATDTTPYVTQEEEEAAPPWEQPQSILPPSPPPPPPPPWELPTSSSLPSPYSSNSNNNSVLLETRINRIRSRWNSQISTCRDEETLGKISTSPTRPQRCLEDIMLPAAMGEDHTDSADAANHNDDDDDREDSSTQEKQQQQQELLKDQHLLLLSPEQPEGVCWKRIIYHQSPTPPSNLTG